MSDSIFVKVSPERYSTDILAMLRSFYPEKNCKVIVPGSRADLQEEAERQGYFASVLCEEDGGQSGAKITLEGEEFHFSYDGKSAGGIREPETREEAETEPEVAETEMDVEAADFKKALGAYFYKLLQERTGRDLPWGNLNGVRPTKPAYYGLAKGENPETIRKYYRGEHFVTEKKTALALDIAERELKLLGSPEEVAKGWSLYIGIPFCPTNCLYCSFTSYPIAAYRKESDAYVEALIREMEMTTELMAGRRLDSVYIGGGTPTALEAGQLERLLSALREIFSFEGVREFTVEAGRADSITTEKLQVLKKYGSSRISINPQTMNQATLDLIGRRASAQQVREIYPVARQMGFDNINMDLILGLPGESAEDVRRTMEEIEDFRPDSLTVHSLAIKRASRLHREIEEHGMNAPEATEEMMDIAGRGAERMGLFPYYLYRQKNIAGNLENVGFAREGAFGIYNVLMIEELQSIVALGAGSISKKVSIQKREDGEFDTVISRCENPKDVLQYLERLQEMEERKRELFADPLEA